jgi:hypothetical protein
MKDKTLKEVGRVASGAVLVWLVAGCSLFQHKQKISYVDVRQGVGGTMLPSVGLESVRYGENIKAYPVSRYVDPNDPSVMHEGHILYRTETTAKWNLHPNLPVVVPMGPGVVASNPARNTRVLSQELESELANQRTKTAEMTMQNQRFTNMVDGLQSTMQVANQRLKDTEGTRQQVDQVQKRMDELKLEVEAEKDKADTSPTPAAPSPTATPKKGLFDFR